jgi:glycosyltransferase involved in cell wall biosynthesis
MKTWHIITCEYPPQIGGVSDYTRLLARQLALAGDNVHIWAPSANNDVSERDDGGIRLHRPLGRFEKHDLLAAEEQIRKVDPDKPRLFLVQWVPHGYGKRSMNLGFCRWLEHLVRIGNRLELMVHEPFLESSQGSWKQRIAARVHRRMIRIVLSAASCVYLSIPAWEHYLRPYAQTDLEMIWLPIPATVPVSKDQARIALIRRRLGQQPLIVGHLGTYASAITSVLGPVLISILRAVPNAHALLMGNGSEQFAASLVAQAADLKQHIHATGFRNDAELSHHLSACDLMLQPYPDGLSTRRTSLMNCLAHEVPVVTNAGHLTEEIWDQTGAVCLGATGTAPDLERACIQLLHDERRRREIGAAGAAIYRSRFDWANVVKALRGSAAAAHK